MAALAPMDSQAALAPKDHLAHKARQATPVQPVNQEAKDHPANRESPVFARNIALWTVECFSPTAFEDKQLEHSNNHQHQISQLLPTVTLFSTLAYHFQNVGLILVLGHLVSQCSL